MARKYEIATCTGCGGSFKTAATCTCDGEYAKTGKVVTAVDLRDVEPLVVALREAVDMVVGWSSYASDYFQEKWDLEGDLDKLRSALKAFEEDS